VLGGGGVTPVLAVHVAVWHRQRWIIPLLIAAHPPRSPTPPTYATTSTSKRASANQPPQHERKGARKQEH
jgi:hypothetical protein